MLNNIDLNVSIDKKTYKSEIKILEEKLNSLQQVTKELGIPILIVFDGWSASGKGTLISKILNPLDPRYVNVYTLDKVNEESLMRPFLWKYATKTPSKGRIAIFDKSWHRIILAEGQKKWNLKKSEKEGFYYDANAFEKAITDSGIVLLKFFLHISKEEQKKRYKELESNPDTSWRVDENDIKQNKEYDENIKRFSELIKNSNSPQSKWNIIEADDKYYATIKVYKTIIARMEEEINKIKSNIDKVDESEIVEFNTIDNGILNFIDVSKTISDAEYKEKLGYYQRKISYLGYKLYVKRKPVIIVYEGWDASGKGGNIKRVTQELDPRGYEVVSVPAPTQEELNHHYLWRFWNKIPKDGHFSIFDRSWYGRVMVERVEGFCSETEWSRAYQEINDMEKHLANHGAIIFKFFLHIDKDEQLRRFQDRQNNPLKQYKITDEDWRNREKWDKYVTAVDEMLYKTDTDYAPWTIVEANNKKYSRIKVLKIITEKMEKLLNE